MPAASMGVEPVTEPGRRGGQVRARDRQLRSEPEFARMHARPYGYAGFVPTAASIIASADQLAAVTYNDHGLVPVIAQDVATGEILMLAWMNAETLLMTLSEGRMVYWSRSRKQVWRKGDTSGDRQFVREAYYDCDGDTLLFKVEQEGYGACHTGNFSCFFRAFGTSS